MAEINLDKAEELDIVCRRGDTFDIFLTCVDNSGNPIDLTQYSFVMTVKNGSQDVLSFTDPDFLKNVDGTMTVTKSFEVMETVDRGTYRYDLQATRTSDSRRKTWAYGSFTVNADIS